MTVCHYGLVSGRVQGVGFRYFVERQARAAGLTGYARNLPDGRVAVLLCGEPDAVEAVQARVAEGPAAAQVADVAWEVHDGEAPADFTTA